MRVQLPIIDNTWIQAYQVRNYELGIIQQKVPWIYSKYINCYYNYQENDCFNHCMSAGGRFFIKDGALLGQKFIFHKSIFSLQLIDFIDWLKNFINCQWYVMCYVDEYYINSKASYMQRHYRHTLLIYGYDNVEKVFYGIGYNKEKKYEKIQITFDELARALDVEFDRMNEKFNPHKIDNIEFNMVKINPQFKFFLNLKELYISLSDYINSVDSFNSNSNDWVYGIDCERFFIKYINDELNNRSLYLDVRYSRLFMELKKIMVRRLDYLVKIDVIPLDLLNSYVEIANEQELVHMLFMKYNVTNKESIITKLLSIMQSIIDREMIILPKILEYIYDYLQNRERMEYC